MDFAAVAARASALITRNGVLVTVNHFTPSVNATTGVVTKGAASASATPMVVRDAITYTREQGSQAKQKTTTYYVEAVGMTFEPLIDDEIVDGGTTWLVKNCDTYKPAGTAVLYVAKAVAL